MSEIRKIHRQAALVYLLLGLMVIVLTFAGDLMTEARADRLVEFAVGGLFVLVFAWLVWLGFWPVAGLLVLSNLWRGGLYLLQGLGWHYEFMTRQWIQVEPRPVAFINAVLMGIIVAALARSALAGWRHRRRPALREPDPGRETR